MDIQIGNIGALVTALGIPGLLAMAVMALVRGWVLPPDKVAVARPVYDAKVAECEAWKQLATSGIDTIRQAVDMAVDIAAPKKSV